MAVKLRTIKDIRNYLSAELSGICPGREIDSTADIIIYNVLNVNKLHYLAGNEPPFTNADIDRVQEICRELKTGKPLQLITGETIFYDCIIKVDENTLIPRPETEELVDRIIKENKGFNGNIIDIGTGSGCIAIALAKNLPGSKVSGIDISGNALKIAIGNARLNNVHISFYEADIFKMAGLTAGTYDIFVSNPPYVTCSEKLFMNRNVLDFEPHNALFVPDDDPLVYYRAILQVAREMLKQGGKVYFEINETMGGKMKALLTGHGYSGITLITDINGKDRIIKAKKHD